MDEDELKARYDAVRKRINHACQLAGRNTETVRLIAVSKTQGIDKIKVLAKLGQIWFGENYVNELCNKAEALSQLAIKWSFIGTLQSNKIKLLMSYADEIQTVMSLKQARYINRYAEELGKSPFPIYIALNISEEKNKSGLTCSQALVLAQQILAQMPHLDLRGAFAIPPVEVSCGSYDENHPVPQLYFDLADIVKKIGKNELSLGMSHDLEPAIRAGSQIVRVGSDLFGKRNSAGH